CSVCTGTRKRRSRACDAESSKFRLQTSNFYFRRVLRWSDPFFDERVPVVAVRTLPQQFRAPVPASHADVRIEIEDRMLGQLAVALHQRLRMMQLRERAPDRLMDAERVWILHQRGEQQVERFARAAARRQMARERQA